MRRTAATPAVVEQSSVPVLVDLWAPWCGPCRMVSPALEQLARERAGTLKLVKVNVDTAPQISQRFDVQAVPTLLITDGGKVLARRAGGRRRWQRYGRGWTKPCRGDRPVAGYSWAAAAAS